MARLSRDKWLSGAECQRIGLRLSELASWGGKHTVYKHAVSMTCEVIGMIGGEPPAYHWDKHFKQVLAAVRANEPRGVAFVELALLRTIPGAQHKRYE